MFLSIYEAREEGNGYLDIVKILCKKCSMHLDFDQEMDNNGTIARLPGHSTTEPMTVMDCAEFNLDAMKAIRAAMQEKEANLQK